MHKRFVANVISRTLFVVSFLMLIPLGWAMKENFYSNEVLAFSKTIFLGSFIACCFRLLFRLKKQDYKKINAKDGLAIVGLSWIILSLIGALPLFWSGATASYTDAFFEITSGFTTTGATIFADVESLPKGILFWRSFTHWLGGMGIIVLYIALLPVIGNNAFQLYKAEAPGVTVERVEPRIKETAKNLWVIYFILSIAETILLMYGGMSFYDALCHTFGTMATGGFSTKNASIGAYSPYIQWVIIVFMFLAGTNFILHFWAFRGKFSVYHKNEEFRNFSLLILILIPFFTILLYNQGNTLHPFRESVFQIVSIITTTGYTTTDFNQWPHALRFILVMLMFIGGCGGSTGGGMKFIRVFLTLKIALRSIVQAVYPNAIIPIKFNSKPLSDKLVMAVLAYFMIFIHLLFFGAIVFAFTEKCDIDTAFTASIASLSNIGPGLAKVGAAENYAWVSIPGKWLLTFLMLAGRLELYSILILFVPSTWKK